MNINWRVSIVNDIKIERIAPNDQKVIIDFGCKTMSEDRSEVSVTAGKQEVFSGCIKGQFSSLTINDLKNGPVYEVEIKTKGKSSVRLFRTGFVPGVVVNYIHPDDYTYNSSGRSPASPSILRLPDERLLISHDIYWGRGGQNLSKVFVSEDQGASWQYLSDIYPCFWGKLFVHKDILYMLGMSTEYGALLIFASEDYGLTWSKPTTIIEGGSREKGGPHKAPMPVVNYNGRLWTAIDHGSWTIGGHDSGVVSISTDADLMNSKNWTVTPFLPYNSKWPGTIDGGTPGLLEGNVVITPDGNLVNLLRYHTIGGNPGYGKAIMLNIDKDDPSVPLTFGRVIDFPGNMTKFTIHFDEKSKKYYSLVNRVTLGDDIKQRNILTLTSSKNLIDWKIERDLINYHDNGWPENHTKVGFQYVDWIFDGDDIIAASRTAINGAYNYHNANHITFHRFRNFKR